MRFAPALALVVVIAAMPPAARAADVRAAFTVSRDRPAVAPRTANHDDRRRQERTIVIVPQIVFVSPGRCWQSITAWSHGHTRFLEGFVRPPAQLPHGADRDKSDFRVTYLAGSRFGVAWGRNAFQEFLESLACGSFRFERAQIRTSTGRQIRTLFRQHVDEPPRNGRCGRHCG